MSHTATPEIPHPRTASRGGIRAGLLAAAAALALLLLGRLYAGITTPVEALADWAIPQLPMELFEAGISTLGGYAKLCFYAGLSGLFLLLGGALGFVFTRQRRRRPDASTTLTALLVAPGCLLLAWSLASSLAGASTAGKLGLYGVAYLVFAAGITMPEVLREGRSLPDGGDPARRRLLRWTLYGGGALLLTAGAGSLLLGALRRLTLTNLKTDVQGMPAPFTPTDEFYVISKNVFDPSVDASGWKLSVGGRVDRPYNLTLEALRSLPPVDQDQTLMCISNPIGGNLIGNGRWKGVRLRDLLHTAQVQAGTVDIKFSCADGYTESIPLAKAMEPGVVLAYELNGAPLTEKHGAPARLLVPDIFGMKNVKWLERIEAVDSDYQGYWQEQGWSDVATIQTMSQLRAPASEVSAGPGATVAIGGIAFAGSRGIMRVEWSSDGGKTWQEGRLLPEIAPFSWRLWEADWRPARSGSYELVARATDGEGHVQTSERRDTLPDGATGYHSLMVQVNTT